MGITVAIIPARAGSKGIPRKNLVPICGEPLLAWSIEQAKRASGVDSVWVSSDGDDILALAEARGAHPIRRPGNISGDTASSESAWLHALETIEALGEAVDFVVAMQATSPLREPRDILSALDQVRRDSLDSLLSVVEIEDFFMWGLDEEGRPQSLNYDYHNRQRRQAIPKRYLENGSFYIFRPAILKTHNNRLGGKIGLYVMEKHKLFQIDTPQDVALCETVMRGYGLDRL